jgi:plastocyanin
MIARQLHVALLAAAAATAQPAPTGAIAGRVTYIGRLPAPVYVFESGSEQSLLSLDPERGLAAAVVFVDAPAGAPPAAPEVTVAQRNWWFVPGILAIRAGQPVRFTNEDSSNHSVRSSTGLPANRFAAYTGTGEPYVHRFRANPDGRPSVITCDIHAWMMAWVYAFDHGHFSQTDAGGRFVLRGLEPRRYRLSVRHGPAGLARDVDVEVSAGREARADVVFDTGDLHVPPR